MKGTRIKRLLSYLMVTEGWHSAEELASYLHTTTRTIRNYMHELQSRPDVMIESSVRGYRWAPGSSIAYVAMYPSDTTPFTPTDRMLYALRHFLWLEKIPVETLMQELMVSDRTFDQDLNRLRKLFRQFGLSLHRRRDVLLLTGMETGRRRLILFCIKQVSKVDYLTLDFLVSGFRYLDVQFVHKTLMSVLPKHNLHINGYQVYELLLLMLIQIEQIQRGNLIEPLQNQYQFISQSPDYAASVEISTQINRHSAVAYTSSEVFYLALLLFCKTACISDIYPSGIPFYEDNKAATRDCLHTAEQLQSFFDLLSFGGVHPDGKEKKGYSKDYIHSFSAVMQQSFRFAVFPKQYITFNPMQYIKLRYQTDEVDLFSDEDMDGNIQPISREDYERLLTYLQKKNPAAILPIQIAYYAGLRIGEACGLAWQDVNLEEQCLTIRRSIRYDGSKRKYIIGPTKRKKVRVVDFGDTLVEIFRNARKEQLKNRMQYGELYHTNYYKEVKEKNRVYYEYYCLDRTEEVPTDYKEISFVCLRPDGCLELPTTLGTVCRKVAKTLEGFEGFHFHQLRHTYTSNLLANGAAPKDVQELLGHSDVSTTMNVYAHSTRDAKRKSVRLLDKVVGND